MGSVYRPKYTDRHGNQRESAIWWMAFYSDGRLIRESTEHTDYEEAKKVLKRKEGQAVDTVVVPGSASLRFEELAEAVVDDYLTNRKKDIRNLNARLKNHVLPYFGKRKALSIDTALIKKYIRKRQEEGAANATINQDAYSDPS
jgi:hypothetical protein